MSASPVLSPADETVGGETKRGRERREKAGKVRVGVLGQD